jgi:hypothetical protein
MQSQQTIYEFVNSIWAAKMGCDEETLQYTQVATVGLYAPPSVTTYAF